ncbi:MAG: ABC transporter permease [Thermodesulfovibrionia bacterium]
MDVIEVIRMSRSTIMLNRMRAFLTILGVVIGVVAVILMVAIGEGARKYIRDEFTGLGSNIIVVVPGKTSSEGGPHMGLSAVRKLVYDDAELLKRRSRYIQSSIPVVVGTSLIKHGSKNRYTYVEGVSEEFFKVRNLSVDSGRFFTEDDIDARRRVCVIGRTVKKEILGDINPLGRFITIGESKFRVIGLMAPKGVTLGFDFDDLVFIPVTTAMDLFDTDGLFNITIKVRSEAEIPLAKEDIKKTLLRKHSGEEDFTIMSQDEMLSVMERILKIMTAVLAGIASISLLVGGVGIMNIMLVSVRERTREIGLRKAVGAKNRDILFQFLTEAVMLSLTGGLLGIMIGIILTSVIPLFISYLPTRLSIWSVALAFTFSVFVGVFFGVYPAKKAAGLDPINALRYE